MGQPRRILQFIDSLDPGGAESMLIELSLGLRDQGMEITVGHFGNPWLNDRCNDEGLDQCILSAYRWYKSSWTLPAFVYAFRRYLRSNNFDAIHAHLFGATVAAAAAGRLSGIPVVGTLHDSYTLTERPNRLRLLQLAALTGTQLVSVANTMESLFRSMKKFRPNSWRTIHNGVDTQRFNPNTARTDTSASRAALGLPTEGILIGSVGRLVPLKRFAQLIDIFYRSGAEAHLVIIGDGPERLHLQTLIDELGAADRVHLLGHRNDVADLLPLCDLFTLWSETEGLSCSIAEAMSCGLPAVASDVGGNHELIHPGETGYLVPAAAPDVLANHLHHLCTEKHHRLRLGKAARRQIELEFSRTTMINSYSKLLNPDPYRSPTNP